MKGSPPPAVKRFCIQAWAAVQTLVKWWAEYPPELLEARVVKPLQQYLTDELVVTKKLTVSVMNTIKVLAKVEEANQLGRLLPPDAFYNQLIRCPTSTARDGSISGLHLCHVHGQAAAQSALNHAVAACLI